jgi:hypothetical protein
MSKYHAVKTTVDGILFDSKREANRYCELRLLEKAGDIKNLQRQVRFELAPPVKLSGSTRTKPAIRFYADFAYTDLKHGGALIVEDVKSTPTAEKEAFRIKLHLMKSIHNIDVQLVH